MDGEVARPGVLFDVVWGGSSYASHANRIGYVVHAFHHHHRRRTHRLGPQMSSKRNDTKAGDKARLQQKRRQLRVHFRLLFHLCCNAMPCEVDDPLQSHRTNLAEEEISEPSSWHGSLAAMDTFAQIHKLQ